MVAHFERQKGNVKFETIFYNRQLIELIIVY